MKALVFGNSHVAALIRAYRKGTYAWRIDFICVPNGRQQYVSTSDHGLCFDEAIHPEVKRSHGAAISAIDFSNYDRIVFATGRNRQHIDLYREGSFKHKFLCRDMRQDYVNLMERFAFKVVFIGSPPLARNRRSYPGTEFIEKWTGQVLPVLKQLSQRTIESKKHYSIILPPKEIMDVHGIYTSNEFKRFPDKWDDNHLTPEAGGMILDQLTQLG
jgi:hypothetical protein